MRRFLTISVLLQTVTGLMTLVLVTIFAGYAFVPWKAKNRHAVSHFVDISNDLFAAIQKRPSGTRQRS